MITPILVPTIIDLQMEWEAFPELKELCSRNEFILRDEFILKQWILKPEIPEKMKKEVL